MEMSKKEEKEKESEELMVAKNSVTRTCHFGSPYRCRNEMTPIWVQYMCLTRHWSYRHSLCFFWLATVAPGRRRIEKGGRESKSVFRHQLAKTRKEDSFTVALKKTKKNKRKIKAFLLIITGTIQGVNSLAQIPFQLILVQP